MYLYTVCNTDILIFLDETKENYQNTYRKYGYSIIRKRPVNHQLLVRGKQVFGLALTSINGLLDVKIEVETVNGDSFFDFVQKYVLPDLMPFNGQNPQGVVVMDNCAIHHVEQNNINDPRCTCPCALSSSILSGLESS